MATIDGRPAQYGVTLKQLRELMELRGGEGIERLDSEFGGILELTKKLYSSPTNGKCRAKARAQIDGRADDGRTRRPSHLFPFLSSLYNFQRMGGGGGIWRRGLWSLCVMLPLGELCWVGSEEVGEGGIEEAEDRHGRRKDKESRYIAVQSVAHFTDAIR